MSEIDWQQIARESSELKSDLPYAGPLLQRRRELSEKTYEDILDAAYLDYSNPDKIKPDWYHLFHVMDASDKDAIMAMYAVLFLKEAIDLEGDNNSGFSPNIIDYLLVRFLP